MKQFISFLLVFIFSCSSHGTSGIRKPDLLEDGILTSTLTEVGMDGGLIEAMQDSITAGAYPNIHSVLILRNNKLVYENYWPGHDENRNTGTASYVAHHRDSFHDIRSITKSITGAAS